MHKKKSRGMGYFVPFLFFLFLMGIDEIKVSAAAQIVEIYDPFNLITKSAYHKDNGTYDSYNIDIRGNEAVSVTYSSHTDNTFSQTATVKTYTASQYGWTHFTGFGFNCNVPYMGELHDASGDLLIRVKMIITDLDKPACDSEPAGDMGGGECDICGIFDCPGWDQYMSKLDDIKNAIPPPPNWHEVSNIFSDAIVPRLVNESRVMLDDLLGRAPTPPVPPPQQQAPPDLPRDPAVDDFVNQEPDMPDVDVTGFDDDDIKKEAPELQYEEDESGGFDLFPDPLDLPDVVPGGDPGAYKRDPEMMPAEFPGAPKDSGGDVGSPGTPSEDYGSPGSPNDNVGSPSNPNENIGAPGAPSDGNNLPGGYMPKPK